MTYYVTTRKQNENHLTSIEEIHSFSTWRKANRYYQKKRRNFVKQWGWINALHTPLAGVVTYHPGGYDKDGDGPYIEKWIIGKTKEFGSEEGIYLTTYLDFN